MPLHSQRDPDTLCGVWAEYIEALGAKQAAHVAGFGSPSAVYRSANEHDEYVVTDLHALMALDQACVAKGHPAPFLRYWSGRVGDPHYDAAKTLHAAALELNAASGRLSDSVLIALDPAGDGGKAVTRNEGVCIKQAAKAVEDTAKTMRSAVDIAWQAAGEAPAEDVA